MLNKNCDKRCTESTLPLGLRSIIWYFVFPCWVTLLHNAIYPLPFIISLCCNMDSSSALPQCPIQTSCSSIWATLCPDWPRSSWWLSRLSLLLLWPEDFNVVLDLWALLDSSPELSHDSKALSTDCKKAELDGEGKFHENFANSKSKHFFLPEGTQTICSSMYTYY